MKPITKSSSMPNMNKLFSDVESNSTKNNQNDQMRGIKFDHIAIQSKNIDRAVNFYCTLFDATKTWEMKGGFSETTYNRLPNITRLAEVATDDFKWHIFDNNAEIRKVDDEPTTCYQHLCIRVGSEKAVLDIADKYQKLNPNADKDFTGIIRQDNRTEFYCRDHDNNEIEVIYDK